jgi:acetylornithine/succinyldiaminopimelate/putrescine aminotransferase
LQEKAKMDSKEQFLSNLGQTNPFPFLIEVDRAEGIYIYDKQGKRYADLISGVAVNNIGHRHPKVVQAIKDQVDKHLHVMVYGEFVQDAQQELSNQLNKVLPHNLNCIYPVNSGTEANEAAIKLAKRVTGRTEIVSFRGSYHGSTNGSLSISGNEIKKRAFRPLLPDVRFIHLNDMDDLEQITEKTAGVILETIQGDAGVRIPNLEYMKALREKCNQVGALLIFDEIQCGLGRTGKMFAFEHFNITPDILTLGKALGGGMPIGALISSRENLQKFTLNPMLGHITTFGGHPVVCASAAATIDVLQNEIDWNKVEEIGEYIENELNILSQIKEIRRKGFMFAFDMESAEIVSKVVEKCLENGIITFWFLSHPYSFRLSPPLTISWEEVKESIATIKKVILEI